MQITKFVHSCLLVETPNRVVVFDPGSMSEAEFDFDRLHTLDDVFITHVHPDHVTTTFVKKLLAKHPGARITSTPEVCAMLREQGIEAYSEAPEGVEFFDSPHEEVRPVFPQPEENGIHYLDTLSHPGDSHRFTETREILALPISGPWGSTIKALNLALELAPKHVIPIHDWHMRDESREMFYDIFERLLGDAGIKFHKMKTGVPVNIETSK